MSMHLVDDFGDIEVDAEVFTGLLRETYQLGIASTLEFYRGPGVPSKRLAVINRIGRQTWGDDKWLERYMTFMYKRAREIQDSKKERED